MPRKKLAGQDFVAIESVADYCMVSRSTVRRWIADGKLSAIRLPSGHYRIRVAEFREFLERHGFPPFDEHNERALS